MCSHCQAEKRRAFYERRWGVKLPPEWGTDELSH